MPLSPLTRSFALEEWVPADTIHLPHVWPEANNWLPGDPTRRAFIGGSTLSLSDRVATLCPRGAATDACRQAFESAGVPYAPPLPHADEADFLAQLERLAAADRPLLPWFAPPPGLLPDARWVSPRTVLGWLADKSRLEQFVPAELCPRRAHVPREDLPSLADAAPELPVVLKAGTLQGNGGGAAVRICHDDADWQSALAFFSARTESMTALIVEDFVPFQATWCANGAVGAGECRYLGAAQQICSPAGAHLGNWLGRGFDPPDPTREIVLHLGEQAGKLGYRGVFGADLGLTESGELVVYDLNFRVNACTVQLAFHEAACRRVNARVSQSRRLVLAEPLGSVLSRLAPWIEAGALTPLSAFDGPSEAIVNALFVGDDAAAVASIERRVRALVSA